MGKSAWERNEREGAWGKGIRESVENKVFNFVLKIYGHMSTWERENGR